METKDIVAQLFERSNAMQTYWGFYITIALGLLAFFGTSKPSSRLRALSVVVGVGFIAFAFVNLGALLSVTAQRSFFYEALKNAASSKAGPGIDQPSVSAGMLAKLTDGDHCPDNPIKFLASPCTKPPSQSGVLVFHLIADALVLVAMGVLGWQRPKSEKPPVQVRA